MYSNNGSEHERDYNSIPEPYEDAFARYIALNESIYNKISSEEATPPASPSQSPSQPVSPLDPAIDQTPDHLQYFGDNPADQPQPGEYSEHPCPSVESSSDDNDDHADLSPPSRPRKNPSKPKKTRTKETIFLQQGFAWNRESLALLCKWRDVNKKGYEGIVRAGRFPGKTIQELEQAWAQHKDAARRHYQDVYGKALPS